MDVELKEKGTFKKLMTELNKLKLENAPVLGATATGTDESGPLPPTPLKAKKV
jgi:hypothetical protein